MKVYLGNYVNYFGIHQLVDLLKYLGVPEKHRDRLTDKLSDTWLDNLLQWVYSKRERIQYVKIDRRDAYSAYSAFSLIAEPLLLRLQQDKNGAPLVDDDDVPNELKSTSAPPKENEYDTDDNHFKRWDWVIDEMIWGFHEINNVDETKWTEDGKIDWEYEHRINNATRLFGKYFRNLWW